QDCTRACRDEPLADGDQTIRRGVLNALHVLYRRRAVGAMCALPNTVKGDDGLWLWARFSEWRSLMERSVRAVLVVPDVKREDAFELASVHDQNPVATLATYGADPALDERVRAGRSHGCADCTDALGAKDFVERRGELAVAVVDQEPD